MAEWKRGVRLKPEVFSLPVEKIKSGWYSDKYFVRTKEVLEKDGNKNRVLMQVFAKKKCVVCGLDEAIAILKLCADNPNDLTVRALHDGDIAEPWETAMTIEGEYRTFAQLETVYLGVIARRTAVATNTKAVVEAAKPKKVMFFPARFDHYSVQTGDGYAAFISGALGVSTDANAAWWGEKGLGTVPHGLIAAYEGSTVEACKAFDRHMPKDVKLIALVDFQNDSVKTSLEVARALGKRLYGVRLDTARDLRDASVKPHDESSLGVCPDLVWNVRRALDKEGFDFVKIVISGGFNAERIRLFNELNVPYDFVGVGSALFKDRVDFTADVVKVNGKPCAKVGRKFNPNPKMKNVTM